MNPGNSPYLRPRLFRPTDWPGDWEQYEVRNEACRREHERPLYLRSLHVPRRFSVNQVRTIYSAVLDAGVSARRSA